MKKKLDKKRKRGQPTKRTPQMMRNVFLLARYGLIDKEIAQVVGVNEDTIHEWKKKSEFSEPIKKIKERANSEVEHSLYMRAKGLTVKETQESMYKGKKITLVKFKELPPDTAAAFIWLKNRKRSEWKDRFDHKFGADESIRRFMDEAADRAKKVREKRLPEESDNQSP